VAQSDVAAAGGGTVLEYRVGVMALDEGIDLGFEFGRR
jgi:hypothetical protein